VVNYIQNKLLFSASICPLEPVTKPALAILYQNKVFFSHDETGKLELLIFQRILDGPPEKITQLKMWLLNEQDSYKLKTQECLIIKANTKISTELVR
jgi:hypothetical protein